MRVVSWNCRSGTNAKLGVAIERLDPDVLVMPESSMSPTLVAETLLSPGVPHAWAGSISSKGLGIFAPKADRLQVIPTGSGAGEWSLAVRVQEEDPVTVVGVWTVPGGTGRWRSPYLRSLDGIFSRHGSVLDLGDVVVAGDFNCSGVADGGQLGELLGAVLDRYGLVSAYHRWSGEAVGEETQMTHWWQGHEDRGFHIDYVLVPESWTIRRVSIGSYDDWGAPGAPTRSDHGPLVVDISRTASSR